MKPLDRIASIIREQTRLTNTVTPLLAAEQILAEFTVTEREDYALSKRRNDVARAIGRASYGPKSIDTPYVQLSKSMQHAIDYIIELEDRAS